MEEEGRDHKWEGREEGKVARACPAAGGEGEREWRAACGVDEGGCV